MPVTANARGVCEAWAAASDEEEAEEPDPIKLLVVSGDEALAHPDAKEGTASFLERRPPRFARWKGDH